MNIFQWLKKHENTYNICYESNSTDFDGHKLYDYRVSALYKNNKIVATGQSPEKNTAFIKASAELIERMIFYSLETRNKSTSGLAVHIDEDEAIKNARNELIERDLFLCHYLTKTPWLEIYPRIKSSLHNKIVSKLRSSGYQIRFGQLSNEDGHITTVCAATGKNTRPEIGYIIGLSTKSDIQSSIEKSIEELQMNAFPVLTNKNNIDKISPKEPLYHLRKSTDPKCRHIIESLFSTSEIKTSRFKKVENVKIISKPHPFEDIELNIAQATSSRHQELFFGPTTETKLNFMRLSEFADRKIEISDIETTLHPIP